jgi:hypothetical protein
MRRDVEDGQRRFRAAMPPFEDVCADGRTPGISTGS